MLKKSTNADVHSLIQAASAEALQTVIDIMRDRQGKPAERLRAADMIIEQASAQAGRIDMEMDLNEAIRRLQALGLEAREVRRNDDGCRQG